MWSFLSITGLRSQRQFAPKSSFLAGRPLGHCCNNSSYLLFDQLLLTHITKDSGTRPSLRMIFYDFVRFLFKRRISLLHTFVSSFLLTISYSTCSVFMRLTLPAFGAPSSFAASTGSTDSYEFSGSFLWINKVVNRFEHIGHLNNHILSGTFRD